MKIVKKNIKLIIGIIIGIIISSVSVYALSVASKDVAYDNTQSGSEKGTVQDAIDDLYARVGASSNSNFFTINDNVTVGSSTGVVTTYYPISIPTTIDWATASGNTLTITKPGRVYFCLGVYNSRGTVGGTTTISILHNDVKEGISLSSVSTSFDIGRYYDVLAGDTLKIYVDNVNYYAAITHYLTATFIFEG